MPSPLSRNKVIQFIQRYPHSENFVLTNNPASLAVKPGELIPGPTILPGCTVGLSGTAGNPESFESLLDMWVAGGLTRANINPMGLMRLWAAAYRTYGDWVKSARRLYPNPNSTTTIETQATILDPTSYTVEYTSGANSGTITKDSYSGPFVEGTNFPTGYDQGEEVTHYTTNVTGRSIYVDGMFPSAYQLNTKPWNAVAFIFGGPVKAKIIFPSPVNIDSISIPTPYPSGANYDLVSPASNTNAFPWFYPSDFILRVSNDGINYSRTYQAGNGTLNSLPVTLTHANLFNNVGLTGGINHLMNLGGPTYSYDKTGTTTYTRVTGGGTFTGPALDYNFNGSTVRSNVLIDNGIHNGYAANAINAINSVLPLTNVRALEITSGIQDGSTLRKYIASFVYVKATTQRTTIVIDNGSVIGEYQPNFADAYWTDNSPESFTYQGQAYTDYIAQKAFVGTSLSNVDKWRLMPYTLPISNINLKGDIENTVTVRDIPPGFDYNEDYLSNKVIPLPSVASLTSIEQEAALENMPAPQYYLKTQIETFLEDLIAHCRATCLRFWRYNERHSVSNYRDYRRLALQYRNESEPYQGPLFTHLGLSTYEIPDTAIDLEMSIAPRQLFFLSGGGAARVQVDLAVLQRLLSLTGLLDAGVSQ